MLIADQGFGDGIQFCRYIPWAAERCAEVVVACSRELQPLIGQIPGIAKMFDRWEGAPASAAYLPLSGLPRLHGTTLDTIPADTVPYLKPEPERVARWKARLGELAAPHHRRVGLVWAGRPTHKNDRNRSVALTRLSALTDLPGVTYVLAAEGTGGSAGRRLFRPGAAGQPRPRGRRVHRLPGDHGRPGPGGHRRHRGRPSGRGDGQDRCSSCSPMRPTGAGSSGGRIPPGTPARACSAPLPPRTGTRSRPRSRRR